MPSPRKPIILLLIPHLGGGGAERIIETLARSLNREKYEVHLALILHSQSSHQSPTSHAPFSHAKMHCLGATRVRHGLFKLLALIWRLQPTLILSGMAHLSLMVLALRPFIPRRTRIIVRQNGALSATLAPHSRHLSRRAFSFSYRRADRIICQTEAMASEIQRGLNLQSSKVLVLPNPTDISCIRRRVSAHLKKTPANPTILAIGRLALEKGFDLLLDALASLPPPFHSTELLLVGAGPQEHALQTQARTLDIESRIRFVGRIPDPAVEFSHASLFVLSSRTEGLPNALLEASAAGLPIVATPASPGLLDLLQGREGVWLASEISSQALRKALEQALSELRPGQRYPHRWIEAYDLPPAVAAYETVIDHVIAASPR